MRRFTTGQLAVALAVAALLLAAALARRLFLF